MTECGPPPKEVQDFLFKQASVSQITDEFSSVPASCSLIAADGKRSLLYLGHDTKIIVVKPSNDTNPEWKLEIDLPGKINRIALSCDNSLLAVILGSPSVFVYDAASIHSHKLDLLHEIRLSSTSDDVSVLDFKWNPAIPEMLCSITSDHTIGCYQVGREKKLGVQIQGMERLQGLDALCTSWSPKGKQLVVGCKNGDIVQLKPELKVARHLPAPNPNKGIIISILWISNYQFCACYFSQAEQVISVMIVDAPKSVAVAKFTNYEDLTFGTGSMDGLGYYFEHIAEWGVIIAASTHSSEVSVLGTLDNGVTWHQWQLMDDSQAQLPLNRKKKTENYPVGMAIDKSPADILPWGAENFLPNPVPIVRIFVTSGQLCCYHMVNLKSNAPGICSPPTEVVAAPATPRPSILPSEISFTMHAGITSTPRSKQTMSEMQSNIPKQPTNLVPTSTNCNFSFLGPANKGIDCPATSTTQQNPNFISTTDAKSGLLQDQGNAKSAFFQNKQTAPLTGYQTTSVPNAGAQNVQLDTQKAPPMYELKVDPKPGPDLQKQQQPVDKPCKEPVQLKSATKEIPNYDKSLCLRVYYEEQARFEKELKTRLDVPNWSIGTEEEREFLVKSSNEIDEFLRELRDTTNSLENDIAYLKALLLQSFAWVEEAKSKNSASSLSFTGKSDKENSKLADIQKLFKYTYKQLMEATKALDLEWEVYRSREYQRMKIPSTEYIYQSLIKFTQIVEAKKKELDEISKKCNISLSLDKSLSNLSISSQKPDEGAMELRCKHIAKNSINFSKQKQMKLRDLLSESAPKIVRAARPSAVQDRLEATLSSLASLKPVEDTNKIKVDKKSQQKLLTTALKPLNSAPLDNSASVSSMSSSSPSSLFSKDQITSQIQPKIIPQFKPPVETNRNVTTPPKSTSNLSNVEKVFEPSKPIIESPVNPFNIANGFTKLKDSSVTLQPSMATMPKSTFSFSSTSGAVTPNFPVPKLDSTAFSCSPTSTNVVSGNSLDLSSMSFSTTPSIAPPAPSLFGTSGAPIFSGSVAAENPSSAAPSDTIITSAKASTLTASPQTSSIFGKSPLFGNLSSGLTFNFSTPSSGPSTVTTTAFSNSNMSMPVFGAATSSTPAALSSFSGLSSSLSNSTTFSFPSSTTSTVPQSFGKSLQAIPATTTTPPTRMNIFGGTSIATPSTTSANTPAATPLLSATPTSVPVNTKSSTNTATSSVFTSPTLSTNSSTGTISILNGQTTITAVPNEAVVSKSPDSIVDNTKTTTVTKTLTSDTPTMTTIASALEKTGTTFSLATTNSNNVFKTSSVTTSNTAAPFATNGPTTTATSPFSTTANNSTIFGGASNPTPSTTGSIFGGAPVTTTATASIFGGNNFGTTPNTSPAASAFGATPFENTTSQSTNAPSVFGGGNNATTGSVFGGSSMFGGSSFGSATAGATVFGGTGPATTSASAFGTSAPASSTASPFGSGSIFGGGANASSGSIFAGASMAPSSGSMFGGAYAANQPTFGTPNSGSVFGSSATGNSGSSMFGTATGSAISSPFGQQSAFGSKPVFGTTSPAFGGTPNFGSPPAFGATPPTGFGTSPGLASPLGNNASPNKAFGGNTCSTFETLGAQTGGLSFGSLAEKSPEQAKPQAFQGSSSFSSWR